MFPENNLADLGLMTLSLRDVGHKSLVFLGTEPNHNPLRTDVFVQTLLFLGNKSISHTFAGLAK